MRELILNFVCNRHNCNRHSMSISNITLKLSRKHYTKYRILSCYYCTSFSAVSFQELFFFRLKIQQELRNVLSGFDEEVFEVEENRIFDRVVDQSCRVTLLIASTSTTDPVNRELLSSLKSLTKPNFTLIAFYCF